MRRIGTSELGRPIVELEEEDMAGAAALGMWLANVNGLVAQKKKDAPPPEQGTSPSPLRVGRKKKTATAHAPHEAPFRDMVLAIFREAKRPMSAKELAAEAQKRGYVFEGRTSLQACAGTLLNQNPKLFKKTTRLPGSGAPWLWTLTSFPATPPPFQKTPPPASTQRVEISANLTDPKKGRLKLIADRMRVLEGEGD
jgi:hypothetical protein